MKRYFKRIISRHYDSLHFISKLNWIFYIFFFLVFLSILFLGGITVQLLSKNTYERSQEKLTLMTYNIQNQINQVQLLTTEINQNESLQKAMVDLNGTKLSDDQNNKLRGTIRKELNWILVNKENLKNVQIYNNQLDQLVGDKMQNGSFFQDFSEHEEIKNFPSNDQIGKWYLDENMNEAIYIRNLYSTRTSVTDKIGILVVYINMTFVSELMHDTSFFSTDDFVSMEYENQVASTNTYLFQSLNIPSHKQQSSSVDRYQVQVLGNQKFFTLFKNIQIGNNQFIISYYMKNSRILSDVIRTTLFYFVLITCIFVVGSNIVRIFLGKLVLPINNLAQKMGRFDGGEDNFNKLREGLDIFRQDEIGILNKSFVSMIEEIQELIQREYQAKLLTKEMEYKFLQAQLDPHFLYNTLNSIQWLAVSEGNDEIAEMVASLGLLLRARLDQQKVYYKLDEELELIKAYIYIQSLRFKSRLIFSLDISEKVKNEMIPQLCIQPLVENAVKYGVGRQNKPVHIQLKIKRRKAFLIIEVIDDGPGFQNQEENDSTGLGLENIRKRIISLYGDNAVMEITSIPYKETKVRIILPMTDREEEF